MTAPVPSLLRRRPARWAALLLMTLALAGCTVTISDRATGGTVRGSSDVLQRFEPRGGEGSAYRVGQEISFSVRSRVDGYITLTSLAPDGDVHTFVRNVYVPARRDVVVDGSDRGVVFLVDPPRGWHRVRASFTPRRTDPGRVTFRGRVGEDDWTAGIRVELEPFETSDWAETRFFVR